MNNDEILKNIRLLSNDLQPEQDISELLAKHKCNYLLKKYQKSIITETFNKICVNERYQACKAIFKAFEQNRIPYAIIKALFYLKWLMVIYFAGNRETLISCFAEKILIL